MRSIVLCVCIGVCFNTLGAEASRSGRLSFGWATESIVPAQPVAIGGQYHTRISGEVRDPITVTALALETRDGDQVLDQAVWVSCDLVGIRRTMTDNVRRLVSQSVPDLDTNKIILSATHTHTAPALTDAEETDFHPYDFVQSWAYRIPADQTEVLRPLAYLNDLERQIARAIVRAWERRKEGEFSFALTHASVARNRRAVYFDGTTRMYGDTKDPLFSHTEGTSDDSIDVLFFWRNDTIEGMAITVYCPSQEVEGENHLSADFWFDVRSQLREKFSADLFVLPLTGASGDQSPHVQVGKPSTVRMLEQSGLLYREEIARRIVRAVDDITDVARESKTADVRMDHRVEVLRLPVWKVTDERYKQSTEIFDAGKDKIEQLSGPDYINWRVSRTMIARYHYQESDPFYNTEVHALRLNGLALATNPFELFTDYGLRMKSRSPAVQTSIVQLTNDCGAYLPTERAVQGGGYSGRIDDGVVGPEGGRRLVEETTRMIQSMWESP